MMEWSFLFVFNSVLLGVGLAMDAFSVSLANGLHESGMRTGRMCGVAGVFAGFQALMPLIGWLCVHTIAQAFSWFEALIPWIALGLLGAIGGKMLWEGIKGGEQEGMGKPLRLGVLLVQGVATSIDALSVGFTIAEYDGLMALGKGFGAGRRNPDCHRAGDPDQQLFLDDCISCCQVFSG